jgi:O-antigen/teichoic acid export membrane protein
VIEPQVEECKTVAAERQSYFSGLSLKKVLSVDWVDVQQKFIHWATKGGLAIVDQGLISGSNFLVSIVLARWMSRQEYGAYALGFAIFLLLGALHQSLLLEPMTVFGGSVYRNHLRYYVRALLRMHLFFAIGIVLVLGISAGVARMPGQAGGLPGALAGAALASPCILLLWLARRAFYLQLSPTLAAAGALLYCAVVMAGLFLVRSGGWLSPFSAFLLMGAGALATGVWLLTCLRSRLEASTLPGGLRDIWRRHWSYGRWALASSFALWVPSNIYFPLLTTFHGAASAAELKALTNCALPVFQTYAALWLLLLPYAARAHSQERGTGALTWKITVLCVSGAVIYWLVIIPLRGPAFRLLYSGGYMEVVDLLPIVGLGSVLWSAFFGPATVLRAMQSPALVFAALSVECLACLAVGVPATWALGVRGAVWSMALSQAVGLLVAVFLLRRKLRSATLGSDLVPRSSAEIATSVSNRVKLKL